MNLHDSYCYATLQEVADVIHSKPFDSTGYIINSVIVSGADLNVVATDIKTSFVYQYSVTPPQCSTLGFNKTYLGISFAESQELAWLMASVLVVAWIFIFTVVASLWILLSNQGFQCHVCIQHST